VILKLLSLSKIINQGYSEILLIETKMRPFSPHLRFFLIQCIFLAQLCQSFQPNKRSPLRAAQPLRVSTFDYRKLASDVAFSANAFRNQIAKAPAITDFVQPQKATSTCLSEPLPMEYNRKIKATDILPFAATGAIAAGLSLLFDSTIPAQLIATNEAIFLAFCAHIASTKQSPPTQLEERDMTRRWETILDNMLESVSCPREFLTEWFINADFDDIRREDVEDFFAWAIYSTVPEYLDDTQKKVLDRSIRILETATSPKIEGKSLTRHFPRRMTHEQPLRSMRHSIEPLRWTHKPFMLYLVLQGNILFAFPPF
jgi:hypothetical protein